MYNSKLQKSLFLFSCTPDFIHTRNILNLWIIFFSLFPPCLPTVMLVDNPVHKQLYIVFLIDESPYILYNFLTFTTYCGLTRISPSGLYKC